MPLSSYTEEGKRLQRLINNLEVYRDHNFMVSMDSILVHNSRDKGSYDDSQSNSLHSQAEQARDALASELKQSKHPPATVVGGYSPSTGKVSAGASKGGGRGCAEKSCSEALGNPSDIKFTTATRPRTGQDIPVCKDCEKDFGRDAFPDSKTRYQSDGEKPK